MSARRQEHRAAEAAETANLQAREAVMATETDDAFVDADEDLEADRD